MEWTDLDNREIESIIRSNYTFRKLTPEQKNEVQAFKFIILERNIRDLIPVMAMVGVALEIGRIINKEIKSNEVQK